MKDNLNMYPTHQRPLMDHAPSFKLENKAAILPRSHYLDPIKNQNVIILKASLFECRMISHTEPSSSPIVYSYYINAIKRLTFEPCST